MAHTNLTEAFEAIKQMLLVYERDCVSLHDEPMRYYLGSPRAAKDGFRMWFGGVEIRKSIVALHLMPIYQHPDMLATLPDSLKRRQNGKSSFNFKGLTPELTQDIADLIRASAVRFKADGYM
jgi:hypothetical protein